MNSNFWYKPIPQRSKRADLKDCGKTSKQNREELVRERAYFEAW